MPKLPTPPQKNPATKSDITTEDSAMRLAKVLEHRSSDSKDFRVYATAVRRYFDADPGARAAFIAWYEALPSA